MSDSPQSPPKDVDQGAQSPDEEAQMDNPQDPHASNLQGYEFEGVKEQDRWLPIANGRSSPSPKLNHDLFILRMSYSPSQPVSRADLIVTCLTIRLPSPQRLLVPQRPTKQMNLMLIFETLLQWPES